MSKNMKLRRFHSQRGHAKERGIPFKFTFEQWCAWWEAKLGPDWFEKRGCKKGQYVMARRDDVGAYEEDNVRCILHIKNTKEALNNVGETNPRSKITKMQALQIKTSAKPTNLLAKEYGLHPVTVNQIRNGTRWRHLR